MAELELDVTDVEAEKAYVEYQRQLGLIPEEEAERTMEAVAEQPATEHITTAPTAEELAEIDRELGLNQTQTGPEQ